MLRARIRDLSQQALEEATNMEMIIADLCPFQSQDLHVLIFFAEWLDPLLSIKACNFDFGAPHQ